MRIISGKYKGKKLASPDGLGTRPTSDRVKEAIFSIIQFYVVNANVLDLFGGSGQMGIEALSRGAKFALIADSNADAVKIISKNSTDFVDNCKILQSSYNDTILNNECDGGFNIVFLDPPYKTDFLESSLSLITGKTGFLADNCIIICEHSIDKRLDMSYNNFKLFKTYKYGTTAITTYKKDGF